MKSNASSCELQVDDHYKLNWWLELAVQWVFFELSCEPDDSVGQVFSALGYLPTCTLLGSSMVPWQ
jgi:hypothetical protein